MCTEIDAAELAQILDLAAFVDGLNGGSDGKVHAEVSPTVENESNFDTALITLARQHDIVLAHAPPNEYESYFALVMYLARYFAEEEGDESLVTKVGEAVLAGVSKSNKAFTERQAKAGLAALTSVYVSLGNRFPEVRVSVFVSILRFALEHNAVSPVAHLFLNVEELTKDFGMSDEQQKEVTNLAFKGLKSVGRELEAHALAVRYLTKFESVDVKSLKSVKDIALSVVVQAVGLPNLFQIDALLELAAIRQLESDADHSQAFRLLHIFAAEDLAAYNAFYASAADYTGKLGLDHDSNVRKMRLLSLASLASKHDALPYGLIASTLNIPEEDVESWIVQGFKAGLLQGRMNQVTNQVHITQATQREFTHEHWAMLASRLKAWSDRLESLNRAYRTASST